MIYAKSYKTWLFFIYMLIVIYFSLSSDFQMQIFANMWKYDKIIHFIEYLGLGFLFTNMLTVKRLTRKSLIYILIFTIFFPLFDELIQYYTPNRIPDIYDFIADFIGAVFGSLIRYCK